VDSAVNKDEDYYFADVIFLVENSLFKVPRAPFECNSEVFADMFYLPILEGMAPDGSSDEQPLRLDGIEKKDFRLLLKVLFPRCPEAIKTMTWKEWFSVLKLSMLWQMDQVKDLAIERITSLPLNIDDWKAVLILSTHSVVNNTIRNAAIQQLIARFPLTPIDRILLARKCHVADWLLSGYNELVQREATISVEEEEQLGLKTTTKLFRVREHHKRHRNTYNYSLDDCIRKDFDSELKAAIYIVRLQ